MFAAMSSICRPVAHDMRTQLFVAKSTERNVIIKLVIDSNHMDCLLNKIDFNLKVINENKNKLEIMILLTKGRHMELILFLYNLL